ncbi:dnaJ homolog subfamily C member 21 [Scaptodrosophila lebanonensis]|uniref:DnaJ homolog subfamily C member 21 n=1 Tax=Drosophila lebanonensis TaxID=7225 RepID=A0A6J2TDR3_DROLE|nr:dnaJ homolog subfamily C member 21 [Scaptodrosophila lebanonensis]
MRCYYEELGVARDSNEADIKAAYRKLALRWHPDKNLDSLEEAKKRFLLIQQAYEVLSDAQERAWYDNHREQILRGKNSEYEENCLNVFQYFTGSCYKGFGDDGQSFYSVYSDVFQNLAAEDAEFMDSNEEIEAIPAFGNADSNYEDVVGPFYAYWQAYSTKKTYEWLCPYDVREIKDRYILRKVEKEMKKIVQKARKERNEEIRNLVSFVRKRDRRVQAYRRVLEERAEANRLKQEEKRKEQLRKRQEDLATTRQSDVYNEGYEEQLKKLEEQYGSDSDEYTDESEDEDEDEQNSDLTADSEINLEADDVESELEYVDDLYCVACNKSFKNAKARANHEESKKHRDNVERLRQEMVVEDEAFNDSNEGVEKEDDIIMEAEQSLNELELEDQFSKEEDEIDAEKDLPSNNKRGKKNKKSKKATTRPLQVDSADEEEHEFQSSQKMEAPSDSDDDWSKSNVNKKSSKKTKNKKAANNQKREAEPKSSTATAVAEPILKATPPPSTVVKGAAADSVDGALQHICVTCKAVFESKNKLFAHLKKTNHGVYIPKAKPIVEGKPLSKSKSKRK